MKTIYMGICCSAHDPAIAIINADGELVFAEATERSLQYKRALNVVADPFPFISFKFKEIVTDEKRLVVAKNWSRPHQRNIRFAQTMMAIGYPILRRIPSLRNWTVKYDFMLKLQKHTFAFSGENINREWEYHFSKEKNTGRTPIKRDYFDHHLCHAASAAYASSFDNAGIAVIDGYGEMSSTAFYHFRNGKIIPIRKIKKSTNSLGFFYSFLCVICGYNPDLGEEWKVMGLAPYGTVNEEFYQELSKLIPVVNGAFRSPYFGFDIAFYDELIAKLTLGKDLSKEDIAATGQKVFEDKIMESLNYFANISESKNLILVGGCALNSSCNGKIVKHTSFEKLFVHYAPADDGTAVGAAILAFLKDNPVESLNREILRSPYHGSKVSALKLERTKKSYPYHYDLGDRKHEIAAKLISSGRILGWAQGKAEFGPRALGNRSIIADPRNESIKEEINGKIKYREEFRPFAPSVLEDFGEEVFEDYQTSYYMERTLVIKKEYREKIPGVTHINGTGRLQSVNKELNPDYYKLIQEFYKITGVPVIVNTSFNLAGKPIVNDVDDIIAALCTSGLDGVVVENVLFTKEALEINKL